MNRDKTILTNEIFEELIFKYLDFCDNKLQSGLPESEVLVNPKEQLNNHMVEMGVNCNEFWVKFETMLNEKLLEISSEKTYKSRKTIYHVKIH